MDPIASSATIDQIDPKRNHLSREYFALFDAALFPLSVFPFLWEFSPISRTNPHEKWFLPGFPALFDQAKRPTQAVLQGASKVVRTMIGKWR